MYRVVVSEEQLRVMANEGALSAQEFLFAVNMLTGCKNGGSDKTHQRRFKSLLSKGVIEESEGQTPLSEMPQPTDPTAEWLVKPFGAEDGPQEFEAFEIEEIVKMGRDGRFRKFCELIGADGEDAALRKAWVNLESRNSKGTDWLYEKGVRTEKVPEMAYLYPQIVKAAQHQKAWEKEGVAERVNRAEWVQNEAFCVPQYNVSPGHSPAEVTTEESYRERAYAAAEELAKMGEDYIPPIGDEASLVACRRLEARLRQARELRAMS